MPAYDAELAATIAHLKAENDRLKSRNEHLEARASRYREQPPEVKRWEDAKEFYRSVKGAVELLDEYLSEERLKRAGEQVMLLGDLLEGHEYWAIE